MNPNFSRLLPKAALAGGLLAASVAANAYTVTLAPGGDPLNCTTVVPMPGFETVDCSTFQADTVVGSLGSQLTISSYDPLGNPVTYNEFGQIAINVWKLDNVDTKFTSASLAFQIYATFNLSGTGFWATDPAGNIVFTALSGSLTNSFVYGQWGANPTVILASLDLLPGNLSATAKIDTAGIASTNLSASFGINPVSGSTGVGGFFLSPAVWNVDLFANNVGFGAGTGGVVPNPPVAGQPVTFTTNNFASTPVNQGGSGSFNGAFVTQVPEPGMLSLVGLALAAVGATGVRRSRKTV